MNKIEFKGKTILDLDEVNQVIEDVNDSDDGLAKKVSSTQVKRIEVVTDYPATEETGVLYIKIES